MAMLDNEIELCMKHIRATNAQYTAIGDFIAKCLIVRMCGRYETTIYNMVQSKMETMTDKDFCSKMNKTLERFSLFPCELEKKILKRFGDKHVKKFSNEIYDIRLKYYNIIQNRHSIAHGRDVEIAISEIPEAHRHGKAVLRAFERALD